MPCPKCASNDLWVKPARGLEYFVLLLISDRRYTCNACHKVFRAPDRRKVKRDESASAMLSRAAGL